MDGRDANIGQVHGDLGDTVLLNEPSNRFDRLQRAWFTDLASLFAYLRSDRLCGAY